MCIPESEWTKAQREFVGTTFNTEKCSVLTVTGVSGKDRKGRAIFSVGCSVCSKDTELFSDSSTVSSKSHLLSGKVPCGCSRNPRWSQTQYIVRLERFCKYKNYTILFSESPIKENSYHTLFNPFTQNIWKSTTNNLINHQRGCKKESDMIKGYLKTKNTTLRVGYKIKTVKGNTLTVISVRGKGNKRLYELFCDSCSLDKELWPEGSIKSSKSNLLKGQIPCDCSKVPRYTKTQWTLRVGRECKKRNYIFKGWVGGFKGTYTKLDLYNSVTGNRWQSTSISNLLNHGRGDPEVAKQNQKLSGYGYGYFPHRKEEQDNLYVIRFKKDQAIKVGRAFDVEKRIHLGKGLLKISDHQLQDIEILSIHTGTHQEVYDTEQWIHEELTERGFHASWIPWTSECFTEDSEDMIYRLLDESGLVEGEW